MKIADEDMVKDQAPVKGIGGMSVLMEGKIKLLLTLGALPTSWTNMSSSLLSNCHWHKTRFWVDLSYTISKWPRVSDTCAWNFPLKREWPSWREDRKSHGWCTWQPWQKKRKWGGTSKSYGGQGWRERTENPATGEPESFVLNEEDPKKTFNMNADLKQEQKIIVKALVWGHANSFSRKPANMSGIDP